MYRSAAIVALAAILAGCGEPKLDGSSDQAMRESIEKVSASLELAKRIEFKDALTVIMVSQLDFGAIMKGEQSSEGWAGRMNNALAGMTADEVIAKAAVVKAERAAREKAQALEEIAELEGLAAGANEARAKLARFEVTRSRFYLRDQQYFSLKEPIIELAVRNATAHPVSRAYFRGTLSSPGRSVPWFVEDFNHAIPGGLESGEGQEWVLSPMMYKDWAAMSGLDDAVFTVEVVRLDGPDNESLFHASGLSENQRGRLATLKAQYQ